MSTCADAAADLVALWQRVGAFGAVCRRCTPAWACAHALWRKHTLLAPSAHMTRPRACVDAAVVQLAALVPTTPCSRFTGYIPLTAAHCALIAATVTRCVSKLDCAWRAIACMARLVTCVHATSEDTPTRRTARYGAPNGAENVSQRLGAGLWPLAAQLGAALGNRLLLAAEAWHRHTCGAWRARAGMTHSCGTPVPSTSPATRPPA